jgi:hypothetical protein
MKPRAPQDANAPAPGGRRLAGWAVLVGAAILLLATALALSRALFPVKPPGPRTVAAPRDPRLDYAGPFRNVDPAIRYVSDDQCADCHADIARSFARHPMGRSVLPVARTAIPPEDPPHHNPFDALGSRFGIKHEGGRVRHSRTRLDADGRPAAELEWDVDYAIGSGVHGISYLSDRGGYVFETPVSWYAQKHRWDLSPGFGPDHLTGRPVGAECLFCHANRANDVDGSINRYTEPVFDGHAIGCQRCHGPGEVHVASRERFDPVPGTVDHTIVNPRHLEPPLREAVCEQCHLEGEARVPHRGRGLYDFRPGLPLDRFWSAFVRSAGTGQGRRAVGHVEQMYQSRCFRGDDGAGRLGCASCHDPHELVPPAQRVAFYRGRCLRCHEQHGCSLPLADRLPRTAEDSCIDCHMPRYGTSDIRHTASTDHRILRNPEREGRAAPAVPRGTALPGDDLPVVSFYRERPGTNGEEADRDLGVALVKLAREGRVPTGRVVGRALPLLDAAVRRAPDDFAAGEAEGDALALQGRWADALAAFEAVLARAPDRERALVGAAAAAEAAGRPEAAVGHLRRAVVVNPWAPDYRRGLVLLRVKQKAWDEARPEAEAWVRLDPMSAEARAARVSCLLAAGEKDEARREFARIEALAPENLAELRARFARKLK